MEKKEKPVLDRTQLETVANMVQGIQYGSVTIKIQDGKVIQIDKTEKYRVRN